MAHNKKIVLSGISLTKARTNKHGITVMQVVMDELQEIMLSSGYLETAPFIWIGLSLRYGLKNEDNPHYQGIDKKDGELALAIELDTNELVDSDQGELKRLFMIATLKSLIHAGQKYSLPVQALKDLLDEQYTG